MSVATHLDTTASALLPNADERSSINTSITTLADRLRSYFGTALKEQVRFGSSTRGTMLTRRGDPEADVDYMCVFDNTDNTKPQTFLDRLRRFMEHAYSTSEIFQDHPTLVLNLNHIRFELVPAYRSWSTTYIPGPASAYTDWISTDPVGFNTQLESKNTTNDSQIKPLVRLLKYWNTRNGRVYQSFELEKWVVGQFFWSSTSSVKGYFYEAVAALPENYGLSQTKLDRIRRAKDILNEAKSLEQQGYPTLAETEIRKLIPSL